MSARVDMWVLDNRTAYAAERNWVRNKGGAHHWLVAVKATFDIGPTGRLTLADEQTSPLLAPEYRGDPAVSSLLLDSDLLAPKPGTDIVLDVHAHAPGGKAVASVPVTLRTGPIDKTLVVYGRRVYYQGVVGLTTSSPKPFVRSPIHYEWAFGGSDMSHVDPRKHGLDARNPVGKGFAVNVNTLVHQPAHAIEYPSGNPAKVGPAGFGSVASFWSPRLELAGTYDQRWEQSQKPLLPDDYDDRFAMSSPVDQRFSKPLRGGEIVALINMSPTGILRFDLPKIFLTFSSRFGSRAEEHRATMSSVIVMPETMKLALVWQSTLLVGARDVEYLDKTVIAEKPYLV